MPSRASPIPDGLFSTPHTPHSLPLPDGSPAPPVPESRRPKENAIQGTTAAGARALGTQLVTFYFRAPVKAFFKLRVDYMQVARAMSVAVSANSKYPRLAQSTPVVLWSVIRDHGWGFIPKQVLPPMLANASVGAILYTSYLQVLGSLHEGSSHHSKRVYPPPEPIHTFSAGFTAGAIQSLAAAPLDALTVRFKVSEMLDGRYKTISSYSAQKLKEIGLRGVLAGYTLSFIKESFSYGLFFASFEFVKQQTYFSFLRWHYGVRAITPDTAVYSAASNTTTIRPHYAIEPFFLLLAGASASVAQQIVQHPLAKIQSIHYGRLEGMDYSKKPEKGIWGPYKKSYTKTLKQCHSRAVKAGGWRRWVYRGLMFNTLRQMPSTSAGLVVFELVRRKFNDSPTEGVVIQYEDRQILLS